MISILIGAMLGGFGGMLGRALYELLDEFLPSDSGGEQTSLTTPESVEEEATTEE